MLLVALPFVSLISDRANQLSSSDKDSHLQDYENNSGVDANHFLSGDGSEGGVLDPVLIEHTGSAVGSAVYTLERNDVTPRVGNIDIIADGALRYITWAVTDRNLFETHHYEIRLSIDGGLTYQLLATDIIRNSYVWNTARFDNYEVCIIQITAIDSVELSSFALSSVFSIGTNADFTGAFWYATTSSGNSTYTWGSNDNEVSWQVWIENGNPMEYELLINDSIIRTGWTNGEEISMDADGLSIGLHTFTLTLISDAERRNDTVYVEVLPDPQQAVLQSFSSGSAGFLLVAVLFLVEFSRRHHRR